MTLGASKTVVDTLGFLFSMGRDANDQLNEIRNRKMNNRIRSILIIIFRLKGKDTHNLRINVIIRRTIANALRVGPTPHIEYSVAIVCLDDIIITFFHIKGTLPASDSTS